MELFIAQILTGLANASSLFLVACGLSLIFGVTRIVNFAHGSLYMIGAYTGYTLMQVLPGAIGFWGAILLSGVAVGIVGVLIEMLVLRPVYKAPELFQLVATFGVILVIQDLALMIWGLKTFWDPALRACVALCALWANPFQNMILRFWSSRRLLRLRSGI